jgi:hypothetical protein
LVDLKEIAFEIANEGTVTGVMEKIIVPLGLQCFDQLVFWGRMDKVDTKVR